MSSIQDNDDENITIQLSITDPSEFIKGESNDDYSIDQIGKEIIGSLNFKSSNKYKQPKIDLDAELSNSIYDKLKSVEKKENIDDIYFVKNQFDTLQNNSLDRMMDNINKSNSNLKEIILECIPIIVKQIVSALDLREKEKQAANKEIKLKERNFPAQIQLADGGFTFNFYYNTKSTFDDFILIITNQKDFNLTFDSAKTVNLKLTTDTESNIYKSRASNR